MRVQGNSTGCFAVQFNYFTITVSVVASQGGYFFMLKTIIVTNKAKQIMYSKQSPPLKGVETAAAVSLQYYYILYFLKMQEIF